MDDDGGRSWKDDWVWGTKKMDEEGEGGEDGEAPEALDVARR
jgi:hypothetical protein